MTTAPSACGTGPRQPPMARQAAYQTLAVTVITLSLAYGTWYAYTVFLVALLRDFAWRWAFLALSGLSAAWILPGTWRPLREAPAAAHIEPPAELASAPPVMAPSAKPPMPAAMAGPAESARAGATGVRAAAPRAKAAESVAIVLRIILSQDGRATSPHALRRQARSKGQ